MRCGASLGLVTLCALLFAAPLPATTPTFHTDDPLMIEPETQDASAAREWDIDLFIDLAVNLFGEPGDKAAGLRAGNVNTIDEVPDSSWFTNRILARQITIEDAVRGPARGAGVAPGRWTVIAPKQQGFAPGFTIRDAAGDVWFVSFDARGQPEAATGAIIVATKIFWTLGYWQTDNVLATIHRDQVDIGDDATFRPPSGKERRMRRDDLDDIWARAHRSPDGSYRAVASRRLSGRAIGGFRYYGTRPDDPNDIVRHEHRRELRALKVFGAWTNLVDLKAGNTLDMVVEEGGRNRVRHYLQDVGSTFGTGANAPREYFEGWEYVHEGDLTWKRLISLGFYIKPWQTIPYDESPAIGRFEGEAFDPLAWKPRVPVAALRHTQPDDAFWAARRVAAFSDAMIAALVNEARYSDPADARRLTTTLIQRRDKIAAAWLVAVTPLVDFNLANGELSFANAAVVAGAAPPPRRGYEVSWAAFDNQTAAATPVCEPAVSLGERAPAPQSASVQVGGIVRARVRALDAPPEWGPVDAYFRREADRWRLVGLDRTGRGFTSATPER
jgi:hypothetical protein